MHDFAAETEEPAPGDWYGIRFGVGTGDSSRIVHAEMSHHRRGIVLMDGVAPELQHIKFADGEIADVYFERDFRIASGTEWLLDAPTQVVALADLSAADDSLGTSSLCDLIVLGELVTQRPEGVDPDSMVVFESTARDSVNAKDWGGITVAAGGRGLLHACDIGFTVRGVYFAAADSAELVDSKVHHYREEGVFDYASDALIQGCTVERGVGFDPLAESGTAIRSVSSVPTIQSNVISWQWDYGIWASFGTWVCSQQPWGPDETLAVVGNVITGDDGTQDRDISAAIRAESVCHDYAAIIDDNTIKHWSGRGIDLFQCADVVVQCNLIDSSYTGARYYRDTKLLQSYEEDVFWKQNELKGSRANNLFATDLKGCQFYDSTGTAGQNSLQRKYSGSWNVRLELANGADTLDARQQAWLDSSGTILTDPGAIQATNSPGIGVIHVDPLLEGEQLCSQSSSARQGARDVALAPERPEGGATDAGERSTIPDSWGLELVGPNPNPGAVRISLAVREQALVRVVVYDVRGRRIRVLHDGPMEPGFRELTWDRSAEGGSRVAAGVYFLRMEGGDFRGTRKFVLLSVGG